MVNKVLQKAIAREMVDRLNTRLMNLANQSPRMTYVEVPRGRRRRALARRIAPDNAGYARHGQALRKEIRRLNPTRGRTGDARRPSTTDKLRARRRAKLPTRPEAAKARGLSLHVGLNAVDPAEYEGWDGALTACEFNAQDMAELARAVGYDAKVMLTSGDPQGGDGGGPGRGQEDEGGRHLPA